MFMFYISGKPDNVVAQSLIPTETEKNVPADKW